MPSVLIIDDEPNIRRMVGALLTSEGFEVRDAADGASGVALADEIEPDLVLLDLMIPGALDGMAVLERLRERFPELPVIMMSGRAGLARRRQGDAARGGELPREAPHPRGRPARDRQRAGAAHGAARARRRCAPTSA